MRTVAIDETLLGDTITAFPALYRLAEAEYYRLWLRNAATRGLWAGPDVDMLQDEPVEADRRKISELYRFFRFSGLHISQAWFFHLGLEIPYDLPKAPLVCSGVGLPQERVDVLISPFSHSDAGTGLKTWPFGRWNLVIDCLLSTGLSVAVCGVFSSGKDERFWGTRPVRELNSPPLQELAWHVLTARCVLTIDTGPAHLAHMLGAPHAHIIPQHPALASREWVMNRNANARVLFEPMAGLQPERVLAAVFDVLAQFNPTLYRAANPDVAEAEVDPWEHYVNFGRSEGRRTQL